MSFSGANVLTAVNDRTNRAETEIDQELKAVLTYLSREHDLLVASGTIAFADGDKDYDIPTNYKDTVAIIVVDSDGRRSKPLTKISFERYLARRGGEIDGTCENEPKEFAVFNSVIYPWPVPNEAYSSSEHHYKTYHSRSSIATITFSDLIMEAVVEGCCFWLNKSFGLAETPAAKTHWAAFTREINRIKAQYTNANIGPVEYRDV